MRTSARLLVSSLGLLTLVFLFLIFAQFRPVQAVDLPSVAKAHISVCTVGDPNTPRCHAQVVVDQRGKPQTTTSPSGYTPSQFLSAYRLSPFASKTRTIAIVDAYDDPTIVSDLASYSAQFSLPQLAVCPVATGSSTAPCFQKVDQNGGTSYPSLDSGWALEISLDVQTAHAICQNCNILLVEASSSSYTNLMSAVDRAVAMGANVVSNSYGSNEFLGETSYDTHLNIPGVAMTFSAGDNGYGAQYPAASRYVTAVGGTTLILSGGSYGSETVWDGTGSGCSSYETKPSWQKDTGCMRRTIADVSADADPNTGAAIFDTTPYSSQTGWFQVGGTSLASPLIASVYALSGDVTTTQAANSLPYLRINYLTNFHDVTAGNNGRCRRTLYLCTAQKGYDAPTGLGTPQGITAF